MTSKLMTGVNKGNHKEDESERKVKHERKERNLILGSIFIFKVIFIASQVVKSVEVRLSNKNNKWRRI